MELDYSKKLTLYLDKLRKMRKLSQDAFVSDIISIRQYRRYLRGECEITQHVINALSLRLGFKPEYLIVDFERERSKEMDRLIAFYNAIANYDYPLAASLEKQLPNPKDIHDDGKWIYAHAQLTREFQQGKIDEATFISQILKQAKYEELIQKSAFSSLEVAFMSTLLDLNTFTDKARLVNKLKGFLSHEHYIVHGNNESIYLLCYYRLAKYYGMQADYKEVISLCDEALVLAKKRQLYYLLDYFYYFKSLSYHRLNDTQKRDDFLALLYAVLIAQENPAKFQKFASLIQKDYALDLTSHALHVLQNKTP